KLQTGINLFHYTMSDVIRFTEPSFRAENQGEIQGRGLELEARYEASRNIGFLANYAYQDSEYKESGSNVANAPKHLVYLRADWRPHMDWTINGQMYWIIDRERELGDPRSAIDNYALAD